MSDTTREAVAEVIAAEDLEHGNWFEDRAPTADEVGIQVVAGGIRVYATDERASIGYDQVHADDTTALDDFLTRLRATNRYLASVRTRRRDRSRRSTPDD